jgi:hypothetical protein
MKAALLAPFQLQICEVHVLIRGESCLMGARLASYQTTTSDDQLAIRRVKVTQTQRENGVAFCTSSKWAVIMKELVYLPVYVRLLLFFTFLRKKIETAGFGILYWGHLFLFVG